MGLYMDAPEPPDYSGIADASKESAEISAGVAREQLAWAKEQYNLDRDVLDMVVSRALATQDQTAQWAQEDRDRYNQVFKPLEDQMIGDANRERQMQQWREEQYRPLEQMQLQETIADAKDRQWRRQAYAPIERGMLSEAINYGDADRMDLNIGRAQSDVAQSMDAARSNAMSNLESFGINPSATRYAALDTAARTAQAAAMAAAGNQAREQTDATRRALEDRVMGYKQTQDQIGRAATGSALQYETQQDAISRGAGAEAVNVGKGLPAQAIGAYGTALTAGGQAGQTQLAGTASGSQTMGSPLQWTGAQNSALGTWGNALTAGYNAQMAQYDANQQSMAGVGNLLGTIGGMAFAKLADGGPVEDYGPEGGAIPPEVSPSGGAAVDDVPARLNVGEFIMPQDVVSFLGEKGMHEIIIKARKQMQAIPAESGAVPEVAYGNPGAPRVQSRSALPME